MHDKLSDLADALGCREAADARLSALLGHPVEGWLLAELVVAKALGIEVQTFDPREEHLGRFREGPLSGSTVNLRFLRVLEPLRSPGPGSVCDYHLVLRGPPSTVHPHLLGRVFLFRGPDLLEELRAREGRLDPADGLWEGAEIYPRSMNAALRLTGGQSGPLYQVDFRRLAGSPPWRAIDPENRYGAWNLRPFEEVAEALLLLLHPHPRVTRTRDALQLDWRGEQGVVVLLTPEFVEVRLPTLEWPTPADPGPTSRPWRRMSVAEASSEPRALLDLVHEGAKARSSQYGVCRFCGRRTPPERLLEDSTCHRCAEERLGFLF